MPEPVYIARCPEHGLHGERTECFVCGGPVERIAMVPVPGAIRPDDPTVEQIAALLAETYTQSGIAVWLGGHNQRLGGDRPIDLMQTKEGRGRVYGMALRLAEGVFS